MLVLLWCSYTVALGVTVGAGCFLLALNVLVFAGIYLQRGRRRTAHRRPRREGQTSQAFTIIISSSRTKDVSSRDLSQDALKLFRLNE